MAGMLFFSCINIFMGFFNGTILVFQDERPVFLREQANKMYSVTAYYLAKIAIEVPILIVLPMIFEIIVYFGVGFGRTTEQFFLFYAILLLLSISASSLGYFVSSIFTNAETASMVSPLIILPFMLFSGFFANAGSYGAWISWFQYISPIKYALEAFIWNEFD